MLSANTSAHYCKGSLPIAFVFSVPGRKEELEKKPAFGATGTNLNHALEELCKLAPETFKSTDRYCYRITNAHTDPTYKSKNGFTEQAKSRIMDPNNIGRIVAELDGCETVILCGHRAQYLKDEIEATGKYRVITMWHTSSQALLGKYNGSEVRDLPRPKDRARRRAELWARELFDKLHTSMSAAR